MARNIKLDNKTGSDKTETTKSQKTISKKRSEALSDEPNPKDMKITSTVPKSDERRLLSMSRSHEDDIIPRKKQKKKIPEPLVTAYEVNQDPDDIEKGDKVGSSIEGSIKTSVRVTPHPSLKTPPSYNNKREYKGDTLDKTLDSHTPDSYVKD